MRVIVMACQPNRDMLVGDGADNGRGRIQEVAPFVGIAEGPRFGPGIIENNGLNARILCSDPGYQILCSWRTCRALQLLPLTVDVRLATPVIWAYMNERGKVSRPDGVTAVVSYGPDVYGLAGLFGAEMPAVAALRGSVPGHDVLIELVNGLRSVGLSANAGELAYQIRAGYFQEGCGYREFIDSVYNGHAPRFSVPPSGLMYHDVPAPTAL